MTTTAEYDRIDAQGILRWLLTEHADVIISVAFQLAQGNPGMSAIIGNASRAWQAVCLEAAPAPASATETPVRPEVGSRDDRTSETPTETLLDADTLNAAADRLDALPPGGAALTGPYWYGQGFKDAVAILRDWADCPEALGPITGQARSRSSASISASPENDPNGHNQHCPCHDTLDRVRRAVADWGDAPGAALNVIRHRLNGGQ
jgi:hypothetical protein